MLAMKPTKCARETDSWFRVSKIQNEGFSYLWVDGGIRLVTLADPGCGCLYVAIYYKV